MPSKFSFTKYPPSKYFGLNTGSLSKPRRLLKCTASSQNHSAAAVYEYDDSFSPSFCIYWNGIVGSCFLFKSYSKCNRYMRTCWFIPSKASMDYLTDPHFWAMSCYLHYFKCRKRAIWLPLSTFVACIRHLCPCLEGPQPVQATYWLESTYFYTCVSREHCIS